MFSSWPIALYLMPKQNLPNTYIFSIWHLTTFLCLGTPENTLALHLGVIFNSEITKKHKMRNM